MEADKKQETIRVAYSREHHQQRSTHRWMSLPESLHASRSISVGDVLSGTVFPHEDCSLLDHRHHGRIPSREFRNETDSIVQLGSDKRHVVKRLAWDVYHFAHVLLKRSTCGGDQHQTWML
ncbi:unnamed protein product [Lampetra planeri]